MKKRIKFQVVYNFDRTGYLKNNGTAAILIRAYLHSKCRYFNTGVYVKPDQWDSKSKRVKNHRDFDYLNSVIYGHLAELESFENEVSKKEGAISLDRLSHYSQENTDLTFTDFYWEQLKKSNIKKGSFIEQRQTLYKLIGFKETVYFHELNYRFIYNFNSYLSKGLGLGINTVARHHKNLKKYINLAINFDYLDISKNPYKKFKVEKKPTSRAYLTESELELFENVQFPKEKEYLNLIRDFFLFCCYTGLRYSDASRITREFVSITPQGTDLFLKAQKTAKPYHFNLRKLFPVDGQEMSRPEIILHKYLGKINKVFGGDPKYNRTPIFQGLSNQYLNRELKNIASLLDVREEIKKNISTHVARHTFGTIMADKVPVTILQELMQHSKISETMIYVHMDKTVVHRSLEEANWKRNG
ncbi:MAG: site-specific integrase [Bacteroidota bacterium]